MVHLMHLMHGCSKMHVCVCDAIKCHCQSFILETERYLLIQWIDSEDAMFDTVSARVITPPEGVDVLDLKCGDFCQASYEHRHYKVKVMAAGKWKCCIEAYSV